MKISLNLGKVILISSAAVMCFATSALATVGNPTESVLRNEQVQNLEKNTHGQYSKKAWSHMSDEQKQKARAQENKRLHKIAANKEAEHQEGTEAGQSTSQIAQ